jgi:RND family efflux transporter MFP subunit
VRRSWIWIAVLVALSAVVWWMTRAGGGVSSGAPLVSAQRGVFEITVETQGELQAVESRVVGRQRMNFWSPSQIVQLAPEGTVVEAGDFLVQLDTGEAERQLEQQQNALLNAQAELASTAATQASRMAELESALQNQEYAYEQAKLRHEQMKYEAEIKRREQEIEFKKAELALGEARDRIEAQKVIAEAEHKKAELKVHQAELEVKNAQEALTAMTITAPEPGLVVYRKFRGEKIKVGDSTWPGMELIELPDLSTMQVATRVNEVDVQLVALEQPVEVSVDAIAGARFEGKVTRIANLARKEEGAKVKTFEVQVLLESSDETLRPGMTARCRILTQRLEDVVHVPLDAIFEEDGVNFVRLEGGERREVTLGPRNRDRVVVESGLEGGERIQLKLSELPEGASSGVEKSGPNAAQGAGSSSGGGGGGRGSRQGRSR